MGLTNFLNPPPESSSKTFLNKVYDGGVASDNSMTILPQNNTAGLAAITSRKGMLVYNNETDEVMVDKGSGFVVVGGGASIPGIDNNRQLLDSDDELSVGWNARILQDSTGGLAMEWHNRRLFDGSGLPSIRYFDQRRVELLPGQGEPNRLRFWNGDQTFYSEIIFGGTTQNNLFALPVDQGNSGDVLTSNGLGGTSWQAPGGGGANTDLSNLTSPTQINQDLQPDIDTARNIGSSGARFGQIFVTTIRDSANTTGDASEVLTANGDGTFTWAPAASGGANTNLSNLDAPTAINQDLRFASISGGTTQITPNIANYWMGSSPFFGKDQGSNSGVAFGTLDLADDAVDNGGTVALFSGAGPQVSNVNDIGTSDVNILTGDVIIGATATPGTLYLSSGSNYDASGSGQSGSISMYTGDADSSGGSGPIGIQTGNASNGDSGNIVIETGTATGTRGHIELKALFAKMPTGTVDPTAPAGSVYYNTGTNKLRLYDGTTWVDLN